MSHNGGEGKSVKVFMAALTIQHLWIREAERFANMIIEWERETKRKTEREGFTAEYVTKCLFFS